MGRYKGGLTTKIHMSCNEYGLPLKFHLTAGHRHDAPYACLFLENLQPFQSVLADRAYDSDAIITMIEDKGTQACIPFKSNRVSPREYDKTLYKQRNTIKLTPPYILVKQNILFIGMTQCFNIFFGCHMQHFNISFGGKIRVNKAHHLHSHCFCLLLGKASFVIGFHHLMCFYKYLLDVFLLSFKTLLKIYSHCYSIIVYGICQHSRCGCGNRFTKFLAKLWECE